MGEGTGLVEWCQSTISSFALREGLLDRLQSRIGFDGAFVATVDPASLLYTSGIRRNMPAEASAAFIRAEFGQPDLNQVRQLARSKSPVGWLDGDTGGCRSSSLRYREAMQPFGLGDELRVVLRVDGLSWGLLCLHRAERTRSFTANDADLLGRLSSHAGEGLRRSVIAEAAIQDWSPDGPEVAVIRAGGDIESVTPAAARWLAELGELDIPQSKGLPTVVRAVIDRLGHKGSPDATDSWLPRARVRSPSGRWLVLHASTLGGPTEPSIRSVVVIEPASPTVLLPLVVAAYGLTAREAEVAQRALIGLARKTIASDLRISLHTVNDHLKAIFAKVGVSSVGQLRARISQDQTTTGNHHRTPAEDARPAGAWPGAYGAT